MAATVSCSMLTLSSQMRNLSLTSSSFSPSISNSSSLSFSTTLSHPLFSQGTIHHIFFHALFIFFFPFFHSQMLKIWFWRGFQLWAWLVSGSNCLSLSTVQKRASVVCEAAPKKVDSAVKRARQAEKRRIYNKARKSEIKTRSKKVQNGMVLFWVVFQFNGLEFVK